MMIRLGIVYNNLMLFNMNENRSDWDDWNSIDKILDDRLYCKGFWSNNVSWL